MALSLALVKMHLGLWTQPLSSVHVISYLLGLREEHITYWEALIWLVILVISTQIGKLSM
jgi:hypothetical protein